MKKSALFTSKDIFVIILASLATAVSLEIFLLPSNVVIGGALGIASILDIMLTNGNPLSTWYFSAGIWLFAVNIPILIYCFVCTKPKFAAHTTLYVASLSIFLIALRLTNVAALLEQAINANSTGDRIVYIIIGAALHGVSLPMVLSQNCSTGGSDIVGLVMQKNQKISSSFAMRMILGTNIVIVLLSSVAYYIVYKDITSAVNMFIYSISAMFVCEVVQEVIFSGFSSALELEITTEKREEVKDALLAELKHGVTAINVVGGYTQQEKSMLVCVINKRQLTLARKIIHKVDPQAFAYVETVKEVIGKGFVNKEDEFFEDEPSNN